MSEKYTANHLEAIGHMFLGGSVEGSNGATYKMKGGVISFYLPSTRTWSRSNNFHDGSFPDHKYYLFPLGEDPTKPQLQFMQVLTAMWNGETGVWKMINKPGYVVGCDKDGNVSGFCEDFPMFGKEMKNSGLWIKVEEGDRDE